MTGGVNLSLTDHLNIAPNGSFIEIILGLGYYYQQSTSYYLTDMTPLSSKFANNVFFIKKHMFLNAVIHIT